MIFSCFLGFGFWVFRAQMTLNPYIEVDAVCNYHVDTVYYNSMRTNTEHICRV